MGVGKNCVLQPSIYMVNIYLIGYPTYGKNCVLFVYIDMVNSGLSANFLHGYFNTICH